MPWITPKTDWATGNLVATSDLNNIGNDLAYLKAPPTDLVNVNEASDYTTTSTSFVDVDAGGDPDLSLTITPAGGDVVIAFAGTVAWDGGGSTINIHLDVAVDGVRLGGDDGLVVARSAAGNVPVPVSFVVIKQGLSAGSPHTFKLQWKKSVGGGGAILYAGAGTTNLDLHPQFWVREVS